MAVPKQKQSKGRRNRRRAHDALRSASLSYCPNCQEPKLPHRVCGYCGYYGDRKVLEFQEEALQ